MCSPIGPTGPPRVAVPRVCLRVLKNLQKYSNDEIASRLGVPWYGRYQTAWRYHVLRLHRVYTSAMAGAAFDREGRKREPPALLQPPEGVEVPQSDFWEYRWGDEFDSCPGGKPNEAVWDYEYGYMRNHELQFYRKENAECVTKAGHGLLQITSLFHPGGVDNPKAAYALHIKFIIYAAPGNRSIGTRSIRRAHPHRSGS